MSEQATVTVQDKIRRYLVEQYPVVDTMAIGDEDTLGGVIDSLAVLGLVGFLEPEFSIEINPSDLTDENFDSISSISRLVQRRVVSRV